MVRNKIYEYNFISLFIESMLFAPLVTCTTIKSVKYKLETSANKKKYI